MNGETFSNVLLSVLFTVINLGSIAVALNSLFMSGGIVVVGLLPDCTCSLVAVLRIVVCVFSKNSLMNSCVGCCCYC